MWQCQLTLSRARFFPCNCCLKLTIVYCSTSHWVMKMCLRKASLEGRREVCSLFSPSFLFFFFFMWNCFKWRHFVKRNSSNSHNDFSLKILCVIINQYFSRVILCYGEMLTCSEHPSGSGEKNNPRKKKKHWRESPFINLN